MKYRRSIHPGSNTESTGSSNSGEPVFIAVGKVHRPHGIKGEVLMEVYTDFPERLKSGKTLFVGETYEPIKIIQIRKNNLKLLVLFEGMNSPEEAGRLRNATVYVRADRLPKLPEGEYYYHELFGLSVIKEDGAALGELTEVIETGANDVYVIRTPDGEEILLPALEDVILKVDLKRKVIVVRPPDWL